MYMCVLRAHAQYTPTRKTNTHQCGSPVVKRRVNPIRVQSPRNIPRSSERESSVGASSEALATPKPPYLNCLSKAGATTASGPGEVMSRSKKGCRSAGGSGEVTARGFSHSKKVTRTRLAGLCGSPVSDLKVKTQKITKNPSTHTESYMMLRP